MVHSRSNRKPVAQPTATPQAAPQAAPQATPQAAPQAAAQITTAQGTKTHTKHSNKTKTVARPSFSLTGNDGVQSQYVSAGAIFYTIFNGSFFFLMQKRRDRLEDFGGKSSPGDHSIEDVIIRETMEELNLTAPKELQPQDQPITKDFLSRALPTSHQYLLPKSKYVLCFVRLHSHKLFDLEQFGKAEYNPDGEKMVDRELVWVNRDEVLKSTLHPRLSCIKNILPGNPNPRPRI